MDIYSPRHFGEFLSDSTNLFLLQVDAYTLSMDTALGGYYLKKYKICIHDKNNE